MRQDLSKLIDLDYISVDLFELAPLSEYEVYIKNFGQGDARQVATQYNDSAWVTCGRVDVLSSMFRQCGA